MLPRVNPVILLGLVVVFILSLAISAGALQSMGMTNGSMLGAQPPAGGGAGAALGVGEAQMGKPFQMATDGPNTFSCSGLMRYILRTTGVDANAPWVPEEYLGRYAPVAPGNLQPGDIVIYPNWATMYAGNGMLLNANEVLGHVTHTPMDVAGVPEGIVRPYSQQPQSGVAPTPPYSQQPQSGVAPTPLGQSTVPLAQQQYLDQSTDPAALPPVSVGDSALPPVPLP